MLEKKVLLILIFSFADFANIFTSNFMARFSKYENHLIDLISC